MGNQIAAAAAGRRFAIVVLALVSAALGTACAAAKASGVEEETMGASPLRLGSPFGSHMVVQRDVPVPIWGVDAPGRSVRIESGDMMWVARADADGRWRADIGPFATGGPYQITVEGSGTIVLDDVLAGEVWLASGQSNMEWYLTWSADGEKEVADANWPSIRLLTIPKNGTSQPVDFVDNEGWKPCTPDSAMWFSAVAYHFGRELHQELGVPVGLINCSWGGASMEAWTRLGAMADDPVLSWTVDEHAKDAAVRNDPVVMGGYRRALAEWSASTGATPSRDFPADPGDNGLADGHAAPDFDDTAWPAVQVPEDTLATLDGIDGVFWFRRAFDLPAGWEHKELVLTLGAVDDMDVTYLNGVEVGRTGEETPGFWSAPRRYSVPAGTAVPGRNLLAVRVFDRAYGGGFTSRPDSLALAPADGSAPPLPLSGTWRYDITVRLPGRPPSPVAGEQSVPSLLYNGMIHPLLPLRFRGVIWYQGESNAARHEQYRHLSEVMITDWRRQFGHGDFPFLLVQLAGFDVDWTGWLEVMEAQLNTLDLPNTAMAVAADIGDPRDIHPANKRDVGHRLALAARATVYGEDIVFSGPVPTGGSTEAGAVRLRFRHVGGGLVSKDGGDDVSGFEIAGEDGVFHPADARIDGATVVVSSPAVPAPRHVRYAWRNYPRCDLYNAEGLPAPPFRLRRD